MKNLVNIANLKLQSAVITSSTQKATAAFYIVSYSIVVSFLMTQQFFFSILHSQWMGKYHTRTQTLTQNRQTKGANDSSVLHECHNREDWTDKCGWLIPQTLNT